ncbi:putative ATP-grasp superfamily ATP-dependent carboligase [Algoriphagus ratkowskyi]|uniref:ATP-grasp domain-containing protein n=1 Tax=Algoriphagus ratkowskyi TaxID=57028 RepID=A0A2W7RDX8_9BACT|nr:ATP-grasp domain-containing protein [Algoriphagus ratkowskyi]PZX59153.1 putative ATP-grasp superfamily ATP-dependent carboligase [Algoriphagus ratkowskyi]TXD77562.1 ATP-grasp domain-containing protein [Algoriphagus ratkowskyi]
MQKIVDKVSFSVLIPDGDTPNTLSIVRCLGEIKKIKIFVLSKDKNHPVRYSRHITKFLHYPNVETEEGKLKAIIEAIEETNADILLPIDIEFIRLAAANKDILSKLIAVAPIPEIEAFDTANDKWLLSKWLKVNDLPQPETILFKSTDNLDDIISTLTFPIILKPIIGCGGRGIQIIKNIQELYNWNNKFKNSEDHVIQSYINGYDIDCSVISIDGKIIIHTIQKSIKYVIDDPWAYAMEFADNEAVYEIVKEIVEKFNWTGVNNIALRYDENTQDFKVIEMNPRYWASVLATLFTGVNFPYTSCLLALKKEVPKTSASNKIVIRSGDALKMMMKRFTKQNYLHYNNTYLELTIKDPIPTIAKIFR